MTRAKTHIVGSDVPLIEGEESMKLFAEKSAEQSVRDGMRSKPMAKVSKKQKSKLAWRAKRKRELWDHVETEGRWAGWRLNRICGLCNYWILEFSDCELDHKRCLGMRGDGDVDSNTHLVHARGNRAKASVSLEKYLELPLEVRRKNCGIS